MRYMGRWWFLAVVVGLCHAGQTAQAIVIRHDRLESSYRNLANQSPYASVGFVQGSNDLYAWAGSGVLIAPNWVLTAGHVVQDSLLPARSLTFKIGARTVSADSWVVNQGWIDSNFDPLQGWDVGLIHLSGNLLSNVTPAKLYRGTNEIGSLGTMVGYGGYGSGALQGDYARSYDYIKRAAQNMIDANPFDTTSGGRVLWADFDNPLNRMDNQFGSAIPVSLEGAVYHGDSGGGLFINTSTGTYLAGITSFGQAYNDFNIDSDYGDVMGWTRVSTVYDWIMSVITSPVVPIGSSNNPRFVPAGRSSTRFDAEPVPEPTSIATLAVMVTTLGLALAARCQSRGRRRAATS